jgi:hypothetical protein
MSSNTMPADALAGKLKRTEHRRSRAAAGGVHWLTAWPRRASTGIGLPRPAGLPIDATGGRMGAATPRPEMTTRSNSTTGTVRSLNVGALREVQVNGHSVLTAIWKRMGDPGFLKRFARAGRPGAYHRVLREGEIAAGDRIDVVSRPRTGSRVRSSHARSSASRSYWPPR